MIWLGGLCVGLAGVFLVKYSIDQGLLGPTARVSLGVAIGLALHGLAEWLRRRNRGSHPALAALAGGASLTLFAAGLASLHLYQLLPPGPTFALLATVAMGTMALALVHGPVLAILGILGAYLVPLLVSDSAGDPVIALVYSLIVSVAALALLHYVHRGWLWWGILLGALGWWLITLQAPGADAVRGTYLALLTWAILAIPTRNWGLRPQAPDHTSAASSELHRTALPALLLLALAMSLSIWQQGFTPAALRYWAPPVAVLILSGRIAYPLRLVPWASLLFQWPAWLGSQLHPADRGLQLSRLAETSQREFLLFALAMAALYSILSWWSGRPARATHSRFSLTCLAPICWLALAYLLVSDLSSDWRWSLLSLSLGVAYLGLSSRALAQPASRDRAAWLILGGHLAYSLAASMYFREAGLTLALAVQAITLSALLRRFDTPGMDWLMKGLLALIMVRLALNPWLLSYPEDVHWSLWTYGGSTLCCATAAFLIGRSHRLRPWLEAVSVQLLVLFIAAETRYQLYDGRIFSWHYSLTEAAINTLAWSALGLVYRYRATLSDSLPDFYRLLGSLLLMAAAVNYLVCLVNLNPWFGDGEVGVTPLWNVLLPAYGLPVFFALLASRSLPDSWRKFALWLAAAGLFVFINLEIRHLWQGRLSLSLGTPEGELYTYSLVWLALAIAAIVAGRRWGREGLYKAGNAVIGAVVVKLFLVDMAGLEGLWRVASFMGLGLSLLGLAYLYRQADGTAHPDGGAREGS